MGPGRPATAHASASEDEPLPQGSGDAASEVEAQETPAEILLPSDPAVVYLGGLFVIAVLAACYVAEAIVLPIVLAVILNLLLQPLLRGLERVHMPRPIGAFLLILLLFGTLVGFGAALSVPTHTWAMKLPEGVPRLQERLSFLREPINATRDFLRYAQGIASGDVYQPSAPPAAPAAAATTGSSLSETIFVSTRAFAAGLFTTVLLLFFLLVSGDVFLRRLVEILPRFSNKRQAVEISQQIEQDISAYLLTITLMNIALGLATTLVMWLCGMSDPLLWGAVALLLNYVPILGPVIGAAIFLLAGLLVLDPLWLAFMPAGLYLTLHITESAYITPMLVARRFTINPVLIIMSLFFWDWMWGVPGMILAVPMLAIAKIVCGRIRPLAAIGHFLEG